MARLFAQGFAFVLDQIEERLEVGGIELTLPDGSRRRIGFKAEGPVAVVRLNSWTPWFAWRPPARSAGTSAWAKGEWTSPDPVPLFDLFTANARTLGDTGRAKGSARLLNLRSRTDAATTTSGMRGRTSRRTTTSATTSTPRGSTPR